MLKRAGTKAVNDPLWNTETRPGTGRAPFSLSTKADNSIVNLNTVALSAAVWRGAQNCCLTVKHSISREGSVVEALQQKNEQTATIEITSKGFEPSSLTLKTGVPAKVNFVRKTDETCATEVVIKEYGINRKLPVGETVTIELTPRKGELTFACGMEMFKGKLIVE
jgi:plastocyanin domain-containing protein